MITETEGLLMSIIDQFARSQRNIIQDIATVNKKESYPYIPISFTRVFSALATVKELILKDRGEVNLSMHALEDSKPKFIDYGAGIGINMYLAYQLGFK